MDDDQVSQRELNRQTWRGLQEHGVVAGQELAVDAFFFAPDERSARALVADLRGSGWTATARSHRHGVLRRRTTWAVEATRALPAVDLPALDAMVDLLARHADEHGAEFDGWGAEAPGDEA